MSKAEVIAAQPVEKVQWKTSTADMRTLLEEWKGHQRSAVRLDKDDETALWQRFSKARNAFDKARRTHFAELEGTRSEAKDAKVHLVARAEDLATSTDWAATAGAFKQLMDQWRQAGRASRTDDDALWERFKTAQDAFFNAKDAIAHAEEAVFRANLEVKLGLLVEAEALLPVTNLEAAKSALRTLQDKWEKAGKVPRADIERTEKGLRRVETAIREFEEKKWARTNPEVASRARSLATQLGWRSAVADQRPISARPAGGDRPLANCGRSPAVAAVRNREAQGGRAHRSSGCRRFAKPRPGPN